MGDVVELSIEETNALRIKLGLKPLELVSVNKDKEAEDNYKKAREDEQRKAEEDEVRDRIEKAKNKRKRNAKLDGKSIAEAEDNPDEALDWVARARKNAIASKVLSNLDELEQETSNAAKKKAKIDANYSEADLSGLKVAHDVRDFDFGDERILTLKDSTILDSEENGDELESIQLGEADRLRKNLENKKKFKPYKGYDDDDNEDEQKKSMLSHYDEEIDGPKRKSFTIDQGGVVSEAERRENVAAKLREGGISLEVNKMQEIKDYYTTEEMEQFRKNKKKKVVRNIKKPLGGGGDDEGSSSAAEPMEVYQPKKIAEDANFVDDDDLAAALSRSRRVATKKVAMTEEQVAEAVRVARLRDKQKEEEEAASAAANVGSSSGGGGGGGGGIVLSSVSEFVRNLTEATAANAAAAAATAFSNIPVVASAEQHGDDGRVEEDEDAMVGSASNQHNDSDDDGDKDEDSKATVEGDDDIESITTQKSVGKGIAGALALLKSQGVIQTVGKDALDRDERQREHMIWQAEQQRKRLEKDLKIKQDRAKQAQQQQGKGKAAIKESERERERDKDRERERELREQEKRFENYKPEIKLSYVDEHGRNLDAKAAFKQLSHAFHGKMPGRRKTEKALKKLEDELIAKTASSEAPQGSINALIEKQKELGSAFVVLSQGNKTGITNDGNYGSDSKSGFSTAHLSGKTSKRPNEVKK